MTTRTSFVADVQRRDPRSVADRLDEHDPADASYLDLFDEEIRPYPGRHATFVEGVCRSSSAALACRDLFRDACRHEDDACRHDLVGAFRRAGRDEELLLAGALLTREDGAAVFSAYFDAGGQLVDVLDWLSRLCVGYRREKRAGNIDPDTDGIFQDAWDWAKEAGKDIGQTIDDAVDKLEDALDSVSDFANTVGDLVEFSQNRINSVVEKLLERAGDAAQRVGKFMDALATKAYRTVKDVVKAIRSAGQSLATILEQAGEAASSLVEDVTRALREAGESIRDLVVAAAEQGEAVLVTAAETLCRMADDVSERLEWIRNKLEEAFDAVERWYQKIRDAVEYILTGEWLEDAKDAVSGGRAAILAMLRRAANAARGVAEAIFRGLLRGGATAGRLLELVHEELSGFFRTAVDILQGLVPDDDLFASVHTVGLLGALAEAISALGQSLSDIVQWARDVGEAAVQAIYSVLSSLGELGRDAVYQFGKALQSVGADLATFFEHAIRWGKNKAYVAFYGVIAVGRTADVLVDILRHVWEEARDWLRTGLQVLRRIGVDIWELLGAGYRIAGDLLRDLVGHLVELGYDVWHILDWAADSVGRAFDALRAIFGALFEIGWELGELVAWCARRGFDVMREGFEALMALQRGAGAIVVALLTNPANVFSTGVRALRAAGAALGDLFHAVVTAPADLVGRLYRALDRIGVELGEMLDAVADFARETFSQLAERLLELGVDAFEMVLWAVDESFELLGWVMDAIEVVFDGLLAVLEWLAEATPEPVERILDWFVEQAGDGFEWFRDHVVAPAVAAGKLAVLVALVKLSWPFLVVVYLAMGSLVDADATPYRHWPDDFREFECHVRANVREVRKPSPEHGVVVISDLHMEDQDDIDAGLGHFHENAGLTEAVLGYYADPPAASFGADYEWTLVVNGDSEEFWADNDLTTNEPAQKVGSIASTHPGVHDRLREFYRREFPRRLVKVVGNHDAAYDDPHVVDAYRDEGFPEIETYDYVTTQYGDRSVLIMHGHQFDPYNCDANNDFGKFASNFVSEPLDVWDQTLTDVFGESAGIEGETIQVPGIPAIPLHVLAPYYDESEWEPLVESTSPPSVVRPQLSSSAMFDERAVADQIEAMQPDGAGGSLQTEPIGLVVGHTHAPKLMESDDHDGAFYVNSGTSGWWAECVWSVEITHRNVRLVGWTPGSDDDPDRTYVVALESPDPGEPMDTSRQYHLTTAEYDHDDATF